MKLNNEGLIKTLKEHNFNAEYLVLFGDLLIQLYTKNDSIRDANQKAAAVYTYVQQNSIIYSKELNHKIQEANQTIQP